MDRSIQLLQHLVQAEWHVARGEQHISDLELRIAEFDARGHDATLARALLETFRITQAQHVEHRDFILRALAR